MKKIIILGSRGMLGQMVKKYFSQSFEVVEINTRYTFENRETFLNEINSQKTGFVINCIGKIKQKTTDLSELMWVNSILPLDLISTLNKDLFLVHPSTDCVFNGTLKDGVYPKSLVPNAKDEYGWSKYLGEEAIKGSSNAMVVRVSIIGPDNISVSPKGLLGWFLSNKEESKLNGFANHYWNGITTLEWCKQVENLIQNNDLKNWSGEVLQLGTKQTYNKKQMLDIFQSAFKTDFTISTFTTEETVNRCLKPDLLSPSLEIQMNELVDFFFSENIE